MTIKQLHKITSELVANGAGRRSVCIVKGTFGHALEGDGATIIEVEKADLESYPMMDDDGGVTNKERVSLVLRGNWSE